MMKLIYSKNSPYARRIRVAVRVAGLLDQVEEIDTTPREEHLETVLAHGVAGKVPILVTEDGTSLCESLVIARYLDELTGGALYPQEGAARLRAVEVEALASALMDALFWRSRENRRDPSETSQGVIELERDRALRLYGRLEERADPGDALDMPAITLACCLDYADFRHPDDGWRDRCPTLRDWLSEAMRNPYLRDTAPSA